MIKRLHKGLYIFILGLSIIAGSCDMEKGSILSEIQIKNTLDSLQKIYAPDKRIVLWKYTISKENDSLQLNMMLDNEKTKLALTEILKREFPKIELNIEQLPENDNGMLVNALANNSVINLRSNPRHSAELATQVTLGTPLRILKMQGEWYLVQTPNKYIAWTDDDAIVTINKEELKDYKEANKMVYNHQYGFSYTKPDDQSQVVTDLVLGCILPITEEKGLYYKVSYPDKRMAWVKKEETIIFKELLNRKLDQDFLIKTAKKFNGLPYLWGGTSSKGIDCSGFTYSTYFMSGVLLQRDASQQTKYGKEITTDYDYHKLKSGDLLFFGRPATDSLAEKVTHVALYMGDGMFIHASGKVRMNSMDSTNERFIDSYPPRFVRACRIKGNFDAFGVQRISDNDFYQKMINQ